MDEDAPIIAYVEQGLAIGFSCPHGLHCLAKQRRAMTVVRRLWRAAKYGVGGIASFGDLQVLLLWLGALSGVSLRELREP